MPRLRAGRSARRAGPPGRVCLVGLAAASGRQVERRAATMIASPITAAFLVVLCGGIKLGEDPNSTAAIVSDLTGTASVTRPRALGTGPLRRFEWIAAGSVIEVSRASKVTLLFANGTRYELGESARAKAEPGSLVSCSGPVRQLEPLPPLPRVSPSAESARAGPRSAAVRIRGGAIANLYPDSGSSTLADGTVLRFAALPDASRYRVEVESETGASVFQVETQSLTVHVSPGILKPGAKYYWQVRTLDRIGHAARAAAEFLTLNAESARARAALKESLESAGDAASLALLAEIDRSLGLLVAARDGFRAALAKAPGDVALRQVLDRLEQQLGLTQ